jgi:hypothetical protein
MRSRFTKKRMLTLVSVLVVALAGIAYAFWSGAGGGTGTATADNPTTTNAITVTGSAPTNLVPGGSSTISFTAANSYTGALQLGTIHLSDVTVDSTHATAGCTKAMAQITMPDVAANQSIPGSATAQSVTQTGTVSMGATGDQTLCKGATFTLTFTNS